MTNNRNRSKSGSVSADGVQDVSVGQDFQRTKSDLLTIPALPRRQAGGARLQCSDIDVEALYIYFKSLGMVDKNG